MRKEATSATRPSGAQEGHGCGMWEEISLGLFDYSEALCGSDVNVESDTIGGILERRCLIKWYLAGGCLVKWRGCLRGRKNFLGMFQREGRVSGAYISESFQSGGCFISEKGFRIWDFNHDSVPGLFGRGSYCKSVKTREG